VEAKMENLIGVIALSPAAPIKMGKIIENKIHFPHKKSKLPQVVESFLIPPRKNKLSFL
jgi:hypothetical protein